MGTVASGNAGMNYAQMAQRAADLSNKSFEANKAGNMEVAADSARVSASCYGIAARQARNVGKTAIAQTLEAGAGANYISAAGKYFMAAHQCDENGDTAGADKFMKEVKTNNGLSMQAFKRAASLGGPLTSFMNQMHRDASIMASQSISVKNPGDQSYIQAGQDMLKILQQVRAYQPATSNDQYLIKAKL